MSYPPHPFPHYLKGVAFDLGDTLVEYEGVPLNWEQHYPAALQNLASFLKFAVTPAQIRDACAVLRHYNTRINPRETEVSFSVILQEIIVCFGIETNLAIDSCARAFFLIFQQRLRCFPDAKIALAALRAKQIKIGIFTDVPYGMPKNLVLDDLRVAGLNEAFEVLLTSCDIGSRKPSVTTLQSLAQSLGCTASEIIYVGNEQKDIQVARAFGCFSVLLDRKQGGFAWGQDRTIASLSELSR